MGSIVPQQWAERARYDLETARVVLDGGRYTHVLFCCQQAVEKALKAVIIQRTGQLAPKIHGLLRLAELAKVDLTPAQMSFMGELSVDYMRTRYPEEEEELAEATTPQIAKDTFQTTQEIVQWLLSMLT